jgi:rhomboid protease GluP
MNQGQLPVSPENNPSLDLLVSNILAEFSSRYRLDLSRDAVAMERIREAASRAVKELETRSETEIHLPYISANSAGPIHLNRKVTREEIGLDGGSAPEDSHLQGATRPAAGQTPRAVRVELPDRKPLVTMVLLVCTTLIYFLQVLTNHLLGYDLPAALGVKANDLILAGQYWRLLTPVFLHGSILHIGFNMFALYILGRRVEQYFGPFRFLGLYLVSGIAGNLFSFIFTSAPSLGSSTAIFGIIGAEGVFIYQHRRLFGKQFKVALRQIIQIAAINLLIGLSPGIDNWGHVGGLIGGAVFCWFGGPLYSILNTPPVIRLQDQRTELRAALILVLELLVLAALTFLVIRTRS